MAKRLYIPALGELYAKLDPYALTMLRVAMGLILIPHGCQKAFGWFGGLGFERFSQIFANIGYKPGAFWVTIVLLTEIVGGLCLAQVYRALLESAAGEHGARMTAMDNATRNAGDMIKRLTQNYNRARQANITRELIEIISGAEAV